MFSLSFWKKSGGNISKLGEVFLSNPTLNTTKNERKCRLSNHLHRHYSPFYFIYRNHNNVLNNKAYVSITKTRCALIANDYQKGFPKQKWPFYLWESLHSRRSFVLGELSFARMPSRQYCLSMNKLHCYNWSPELVKCSRQHQYDLVTQHGLTQILGHPKLFQTLNARHICQNWTFLEIQNFGQSILGHHTILLLLTTMN